jgi:deazaflavin-dependent oxidoreductase (nitroreductase family)
MRPVAYVHHERKYLLVASLGGSTRNPDWHYNLLAHPHAIIEVGEDTFAVKGSLLVGDERDAFFEIICNGLPIMRKYQSMTSRVLPVHALEVVGSEFGPDAVGGVQGQVE